MSMRLNHVREHPTTVPVVVRVGGKRGRQYTVTVQATIPLGEGACTEVPLRFRQGGELRLRDFLSTVEDTHGARPAWYTQELGPEPLLPTQAILVRQDSLRVAGRPGAAAYTCVLLADTDPGVAEPGSDTVLGAVEYRGPAPLAGASVGNWWFKAPGWMTWAHLDSSGECMHLAEVTAGVRQCRQGVNYAVR